MKISTTKYLEKDQAVIMPGGVMYVEENMGGLLNQALGLSNCSTSTDYYEYMKRQLQNSMSLAPSHMQQKPITFSGDCASSPPPKKTLNRKLLLTI